MNKRGKYEIKRGDTNLGARRGDVMEFHFNRFSRHCFCCDDTPEGSFSVSPTERVCLKKTCSSVSRWTPTERALLAPILPEWELPSLEAFPGMLNSEEGFASDGSILWADSEDELPGSHEKYFSSQFDATAWKHLFPFETNFLASHGLKCGHPFCFRGKRLQVYTDSSQVYVLDMAGYYWSGTLKDPRMWSCINIAKEKNIRIIWAWTAGNAGLALARIATAANAFLQPDERFQIYLFYDSTDTAMQQDVLPILKGAGGVLIPVSNPRDFVYSPFELLQRIRPEIHMDVWDKLIDEKAFWDITDGWDGAGSVDYRRIFLQVFLRLQPDYVVIPLGTGNLLVGALLAGKDYKRLTNCDAPRSVCGVPYDQNIVLQISEAPGFKKDRSELQKSVQVESTARGEVRKWAPKVAGYYSALLACVEHAIHENRIQVFGIDEVRLREAYRAVCTPRQVTQPRHMRSEPSSAVAFAALRNLVSDNPSVAKCRVLVVNSGCGIMGAEEVSFVREGLTI